MTDRELILVMLAKGFSVGWGKLSEVYVWREGAVYWVSTYEDEWQFADSGEAADKFLELVAERG